MIRLRIAIFLGTLTELKNQTYCQESSAIAYKNFTINFKKSRSIRLYLFIILIINASQIAQFFTFIKFKALFRFFYFKINNVFDSYYISIYWWKMHIFVKLVLKHHLIVKTLIN